MPLDVVVPYITSGEDHYRAHPQHPEHSPAEAVVFRHWRHTVGPHRLQMKGPWPTEFNDAVVATAYVSHGRWMVDCPFEHCESAQHASKDDRRFFCVECDGGGDHRWVKVVWPSGLDIATIEALLGVRPLEATRSWLVGESIEHLIEENEAAGL